MADDIRGAKRRLRAAAARARRRLAASHSRAPAAIRDNLLEAIALPRGPWVSGYWPLEDELDPRLLLSALHERGHPLALPIVRRARSPLEFRRWAPGMLLEPASFGTRIPPPSSPLCLPEILLVPLLAFDRAGWRLGYGGGYYDRTLRALRRTRHIVSIGVAFAAQEVDSVPWEQTDEPLDWIVTELEVVRAADLRKSQEPKTQRA